jgi:glycosyltransferase involved in cell wall biosynthesis
LPIAVATDHSKAGRDIVAAELVRQPEVVVADFPHATVLFPDECPIPSVLFTHNVEAEIFRRHADVAASAALRSLWRSQARKMKRFEDHAARRFDGVIAVSDRDADYFKVICGNDRVYSIPTGVDLNYFTFSTPCRDVAADAGTMVFTGSMDWRANVDGIRFFMDTVWPLIVAARPKARMVVVGHSPPADLRRAAAERNLAWSFTGFVDDVRVHVNAADLYVIPLRVGGGTRIKAFEAMAMGCPIASTSIGVEGLPIDAGIHCAIGDSADALARMILDLLEDRAKRAVIAQRARALVEKHYSHRVAALAFEEACLHTIASKRRTVMRPGIRSAAVPTADVLR